MSAILEHFYPGGSISLHGEGGCPEIVDGGILSVFPRSREEGQLVNPGIDVSAEQRLIREFPPDGVRRRAEVLNQRGIKAVLVIFNIVFLDNHVVFEIAVCDLLFLTGNIFELAIADPLSHSAELFQKRIDLDRRGRPDFRRKFPVLQIRRLESAFENLLESEEEFVHILSVDIHENLLSILSARGLRDRYRLDADQHPDALVFHIVNESGDDAVCSAGLSDRLVINHIAHPADICRRNGLPPRYRS